MSRQLIICLVVVLGCRPAEPTPGAGPPGEVSSDAGDLVTVSLLGARSHIVPGEPFELAVHFVVAPGWHIYWENPGETGLPTEVKVGAPAGFTVSQPRYPGPEAFESPGGIQSYGYEKQVAIFATVRAPKTASGDVRLSAHADWLACRESCIRGKAHVSLATTVGVGRASSQHEKILGAQRSQLPAPFTTLKGADHRWVRDGLSWRLTITVPGSLDVHLFPQPAPILFRGQKVAHQGGRTVLQATVAPEGAAFPGAGQFEGVLRVKTAQADSRFYHFATPWPT